MSEVNIDVALLWNQAGNIISIDPYGYWQNTESGSNAEQKNVFIGVDIDKDLILRNLNEALEK